MRYLRSRPNKQLTGRSCTWIMTETEGAPVAMPSVECWEFVREFPPAMPTGEATIPSPIAGMGWYMGYGIGIDRAYFQQRGQVAEEGLDYFIVCQEQGSNPGDETGNLEAWHVKGLENRLSIGKTRKSVAKAERTPSATSGWTAEHGDESLDTNDTVSG